MEKERYSSPDLLDLRGHFYLDSKVDIVAPGYVLNVFPVSNELSILVRTRSTGLINLTNSEILWTITCPAFVSALDLEREMLALGTQGWVYLWDLRSGSFTQKICLGDNTPTCLSFHPDGSFLGIGLFEESAQLWNIADGQLIYTVSIEDEDYTCYKSLAFSPGGQFFVTGDFEGGDVWMFETINGRFIQKMEPGGGRVQGLTFSPDGSLLACGESGGVYYGTTRVWDMRTGHRLQGFSRSDFLPTFSMDGKLLATAGLNEKQRSLPPFLITVWDVATRSIIQQFTAHTERLYRLAFSPDRRLIASVGERKPVVRWWDVESGEKIYEVE